MVKLAVDLYLHISEVLNMLNQQFCWRHLVKTTSPTHQGAQDLNQSPSLENLPPRTGIYDLSNTSEIEKLEKIGVPPSLALGMTWGCNQQCPTGFAPRSQPGLLALHGMLQLGDGPCIVCCGIHHDDIPITKNTMLSPSIGYIPYPIKIY